MLWKPECFGFHTKKAMATVPPLEWLGCIHAWLYLISLSTQWIVPAGPKGLIKFVWQVLLFYVAMAADAQAQIQDLCWEFVTCSVGMSWLWKYLFVSFVVRPSKTARLACRALCYLVAAGRNAGSHHGEGFANSGSCLYWGGSVAAIHCHGSLFFNCFFILFQTYAGPEPAKTDRLVLVGRW